MRTMASEGRGCPVAGSIRDGREVSILFSLVVCESLRRV